MFVERIWISNYQKLHELELALKPGNNICYPLGAADQKSIVSAWGHFNNLFTCSLCCPEYWSFDLKQALNELALQAEVSEAQLAQVLNDYGPHLQVCLHLPCKLPSGGQSSLDKLTIQLALGLAAQERAIHKLKCCSAAGSCDNPYTKVGSLACSQSYGNQALSASAVALLARFPLQTQVAVFVDNERLVESVAWQFKSLLLLCSQLSTLGAIDPAWYWPHLTGDFQSTECLETNNIKIDKDLCLSLLQPYLNQSDACYKTVEQYISLALPEPSLCEELLAAQRQWHYDLALSDKLCQRVVLTDNSEQLRLYPVEAWCLFKRAGLNGTLISKLLTVWQGHPNLLASLAGRYVPVWVSSLLVKQHGWSPTEPSLLQMPQLSVEQLQALALYERWECYCYSIKTANQLINNKYFEELFLKDTASLTARLWILVEGPSDVHIFKTIALKLGIDLAALGVHLIGFACTGITNYLEVATVFGIDYLVVVDNDGGGLNNYQILHNHTIPPELEHFVYMCATLINSHAYYDKYSSQFFWPVSGRCFSANSKLTLVACNALIEHYALTLFFKEHNLIALPYKDLEFFLLEKGCALSMLHDFMLPYNLTASRLASPESKLQLLSQCKLDLEQLQDRHHQEQSHIQAMFDELLVHSLQPSAAILQTALTPIRPQRRYHSLVYHRHISDWDSKQLAISLQAQEQLMELRALKESQLKVKAALAKHALEPCFVYIRALPISASILQGAPVLPSQQLIATLYYFLDCEYTPARDGLKLAYYALTQVVNFDDNESYTKDIAAWKRARVEPMPLAVEHIVPLDRLYIEDFKLLVLTLGWLKERFNRVMSSAIAKGLLEPLGALEGELLEHCIKILAANNRALAKSLMSYGMQERYILKCDPSCELSSLLPCLLLESKDADAYLIAPDEFDKWYHEQYRYGNAAPVLSLDYYDHSLPKPCVALVLPVHYARSTIVATLYYWLLPLLKNNQVLGSLLKLYYIYATVLDNHQEHQVNDLLARLQSPQDFDAITIPWPDTSLALLGALTNSELLEIMELLYSPCLVGSLDNLEQYGKDQDLSVLAGRNLICDILVVCNFERACKLKEQHPELTSWLIRGNRIKGLEHLSAENWYSLFVRFCFSSLTPEPAMPQGLAHNLSAFKHYLDSKQGAKFINTKLSVNCTGRLFPDNASSQTQKAHLLQPLWPSALTKLPKTDIKHASACYGLMSIKTMVLPKLFCHEQEIAVAPECLYEHAVLAPSHSEVETNSVLEHVSENKDNLAAPSPIASENSSTLFGSNTSYEPYDVKSYIAVLFHQKQSHANDPVKHLVFKLAYFFASLQDSAQAVSHFSLNEILKVRIPKNTNYTMEDLKSLAFIPGYCLSFSFAWALAWISDNSDDINVKNIMSQSSVSAPPFACSHISAQLLYLHNNTYLNAYIYGLPKFYVVGNEHLITQAQNLLHKMITKKLAK